MEKVVLSYPASWHTIFTAVGVAMASAYKGLDEACITWLGDGGISQGDYHYALNFASTFKPPVILNVVNNQWAISTHQNLATGGRTFAGAD